MKIHCFSKGDESVGMPSGEIVIDFVGFTEAFFDEDELGYFMGKAKEFAEEFFADDVEVISGPELERENKAMAQMEREEAEQMKRYDEDLDRDEVARLAREIEPLTFPVRSTINELQDENQKTAAEEEAVKDEIIIKDIDALIDFAEGNPEIFDEDIGELFTPEEQEIIDSNGL